MPEKTIEEAARELKNIISLLTEIIKRENRKYMTMIFGLIIFSMIFSVFSTTFTISICFISQGPPDVCHVIPGYDASIERNKKIFAEFRELQKRTKTNSERLDKLERKSNDNGS